MSWLRAPAAIFLGALAVCAQPDYSGKVAPVFAKRCQGCHGAAQQMAGLRVDDVAAMTDRKVVLPGKPDESPLIRRITANKPGFQMPPAGPRLTDEEIAAIREWIQAGAVGPALATRPAASTHWAFQPVVRPQVPGVQNRERVSNPIDNFVLSRLEKENIPPSPEASKATLLRRVSLDLTGLPPSPKEIEEFVNDQRADAWERVVDRLLDSPHYGEKWARYWLDLVRYADSDGYEKDLVRPYAWRYRNWVIDAWNGDMPYDTFVTEQLAGDLIPNATTDQRVATGFHRTVLTNREAGVDRTEARFEQDVNRTATLGTVFLGLTVACAQCHNHKFDPISQREYYGLFAYSANLEEYDIDAPLPGELGPWLRARPEYEKQRAAILQEYGIPELQTKYEARVREAVEHPGADLEWDFQVTELKAGIDNAVKILYTPMQDRDRRASERMTNRFVRVIGPEFNRDKPLVERLKEAREKLTKLDASFTPLTEANTIRGNGNPPRTYLAFGGDYKTKGDDIDSGVPAVLGGKRPANRLELARWMTAKENPLTARVEVNRLWGEFFGRALVRTTEDFGTQGEKPSNPELLDWLASEFQESGWSRKHVQKLIVMSATYRQSSAVRKELLTRDPDNILLARQSRLRLSAEIIRDSALSAGSLLNPVIGGRSVRPPQPTGIAELGYGNSVKWVESQGPERYRRGLYIHFQRTTPYPMLMTFDAPDASIACTRRARSNTPLQALNLLNDPVFMEAAQGLALRVLAKTPEERIDYAFRVSIGRPPSEKEKERFSTYLDAQTSILAKDPSAAETLMPIVPDAMGRLEAASWSAASRVLLNLDEFITRE